MGNEEIILGGLLSAFIGVMFYCVIKDGERVIEKTKQTNEDKDKPVDVVEEKDSISPPVKELFNKIKKNRGRFTINCECDKSVENHFKCEYELKIVDKITTEVFEIKIYNYDNYSMYRDGPIYEFSDNLNFMTYWEKRWVVDELRHYLRKVEVRLESMKNYKQRKRLIEVYCND